MYFLIMGVLFLIGAASGQMVLKGTESSGALAGVAVLFVVIGVVQLASSGKDKQEEKQPRTRRPERGTARRPGQAGAAAPRSASAARPARRRGIRPRLGGPNSKQESGRAKGPAAR